MIRDLYEALFCPVHGLITPNIVLIGPAITGIGLYIRRIFGK
jgi:hypothetical protein